MGGRTISSKQTDRLIGGRTISGKQTDRQTAGQTEFVNFDIDSKICAYGTLCSPFRYEVSDKYLLHNSYKYDGTVCQRIWTNRRRNGQTDKIFPFVYLFVCSSDILVRTATSFLFLGLLECLLYFWVPYRHAEVLKQF